MSEENVELVERIFQAVNRGDFEGVVALANPPTPPGAQREDALLRASGGGFYPTTHPARYKRPADRDR